MSDDTISDFISEQAEDDKAICQKLQSLIDRALPDAESKIWHAHPVWFLDGNPIVGFSKLKRGIRLMFWSGQSFESSGLEPSGSFKAAEKFYTFLGDLNEDDLNAWLAESRRVQWDYKNIVKRKGRLERLV